MIQLKVLDLMLFCTVPERMVHDRRNFLFHKSIYGPSTEEKSDQNTDNTTVTPSEESTVDKNSTVNIQGGEYPLSDLPMDKLLDLNIDALRTLDKRLQQYDLL